jgi:hypothetical protein
MKTNLKKLIFFIIVIVSLTSCNFGGNAGSSEGDNQKATVKEVIQTTNYTYLRVEKQGQEEWIAVTQEDFKEGDVVYFENGLQMNNFESKELGRTFDVIYFVQEIGSEPIMHQQQKAAPGGMKGNQPGGMMGTTPQKPVINKLDIKIDQPTGGVSIAEIYANKAKYAGKIIKVKGQVTKINEGIMGRNWVHIQDGTADGDNFDLTVTTEDGSMVGEIITFSGTLSVDKDFGAGYVYSVILEDGIPVTDQ